MQTHTSLPKKLTCQFVLILFLSQVQVFGQIRLPRLVSDGMVLQREAQTRIWGWARAGEKVTVSFKGKAYRTITDANGKWAVTQPLPAISYSDRLNKCECWGYPY